MAADKRIRKCVVHYGTTTHVALCDVEDQINGSNFVREGELVGNELQNRQPRRPYICPDCVILAAYPFRLEIAEAEISIRTNLIKVTYALTAM